MVSLSRPVSSSLTAAVFATISPALLPLHTTPRLQSSVIHAPVLFHMSVTPPMNATAWVQSRLTALYEGVTAQDAFDQAFSPTCEVRMNHVVHPLQTFKDDVLSRRAAATHVSVAWNPELVSTNDDNPEQPTVIAGALVVTRSLPFRIRAGPAQRLTHVHFSAKIEQDPSVQESDQRRITSFYHTSVDRTPPIHFTVPRAAQQGESDGH